MEKKASRVRRSAKTRVRISRQGAARLTVHRTNLHIYAQVIDGSGGKVLAAASSLEKDVRASHPKGSGKEAAAEVGKRIAEKAKAAGVTEVAFGFPVIQAGRSSSNSGLARPRKRTGAVLIQSARYSRRSRNVGSPHWMSSKMTTSGRSAPRCSNSFRTAQKVS